jgi:hypothetical protein
MGIGVTEFGAPAREDRGDTLESDIRNSVRRDGQNLRHTPEGEREVVTTNIEMTLQRVSSLTLPGIDQLVTDLQNLREHLAGEGERVQREVAEYAFLSQSSTQSTKLLAESLAHFKDVLDLRSSHK